MEKREAIRAGILGLVVGDALGVPYESARRSHMEAFPAEGMVGFGSHYQPRGTWSDDSSMVLATMASFAERGCIDPEDIMYMFCRWLYQGHFTAHGRRPCGTAIRRWGREGHSRGVAERYGLEGLSGGSRHPLRRRG